VFGTRVGEPDRIGDRACGRRLPHRRGDRRILSASKSRQAAPLAAGDGASCDASQPMINTTCITWAHPTRPITHEGGRSPAHRVRAYRRLRKLSWSDLQSEVPVLVSTATIAIDALRSLTGSMAHLCRATWAPRLIQAVWLVRLPASRSRETQST